VLRSWLALQRSTGAGDRVAHETAEGPAAGSRERRCGRAVTDSHAPARAAPLESGTRVQASAGATATGWDTARGTGLLRGPESGGGEGGVMSAAIGGPDRHRARWDPEPGQ
jgi:hypothetical protein